jgi:hypothetical protein
MAVASDVNIRMVVVRVLEVQPRFALHMGAGGGVCTSLDVASW